MKKLAIATMIMASLWGSSMAIDNGAVLDKEDGQVQILMTALNGSQSYDGLKESLSKSLSNRLTAKNFGVLQKQIKNKFGTPKDLKLISMEKFDQGDRLDYLAVYGNKELVRISVFFEPNGNGAINNFTFAPLAMKKAVTAK